MRGRAPEVLARAARDRVAHSLGSQINLSVFLGLLVSTVFVMPALGFASYHQRLYSNIVFSVLLVTGILIGWDERRIFPVAVCTGIIALSVTWASFWIATNSLELWREVFTVLAVVMIQWVLMRQIFRPGPITAVRIQGAIAVYLLFGISWAYGYVIVMHLNPHAFQSTIGVSQLPAEWMYFSFVTLTTLGYGEITPLSTPARSLAIGEALTGQLYLAVLLARLVAMGIMFPKAGGTEET
jgi:Ion channel